MNWLKRLLERRRAKKKAYLDKINEVTHRFCYTCHKYIPNEVRCDYGWDGQCSAGYSFLRDEELPKSGRWNW